MIEIDGSIGEAGGQVLRTSLGLSALLQKPIKIFNIRTKRPKPGLKAQHLTALNTLARISNAELKGAAPNSTEVEFSPQRISPVSLNVNIGTAGSISLLLSQILPLALLEEIKLRVTGGTDVAWSPPINYLHQVLFPALRKMRAKFEIKLINRGYYPKGMGNVSFSSKKSLLPLKPISLTELGSLEFIKIISHSAGLPAEVSKNQLIAAKKVLQHLNVDMLEETFFKESSPTIGSGIDCFAFFSSGTVLGANALGEKGTPALEVGKSAAQNLSQELEAKKPVDSHLADQLIPFMALAEGKSEISCTKLTQHTLTNISVTEKLLDVKFSVKGELGKPAEISVEGAAFK